MIRARLKLRLLLPPLASYSDSSPVAWALLDRHQQVQQSGRTPLSTLVSNLSAGTMTDAALHPDDTIVAQIHMPPVSRRHFTAAVRASIDSMTLSDASQLGIAHGPRQADGQTLVAWAQNRTLASLSAKLTAAGLRVQNLIPQEVIKTTARSDSSDTDTDLILLSAPWPSWSLPLPERQSGSDTAAWQPALRWGLLAAGIWLGGLLLWAQQLRSETRQLENFLQVQFQEAFPDEPPAGNALLQARLLLGKQQLAIGQSAADDFLPLALATARSLPELAGQLIQVHYADGTLSLTLRDSFSSAQITQNARQELASRQLAYTIEPGPPEIWHLSLEQTDSKQGRKP